MNSKNFSQNLLNSTIKSDVFQAVAEHNVDPATDTGIPRSQLLITTLSTVAMMARGKELPKECYQWSRAYLETIKNDDGTTPPNVSAFLKYIDDFR